MATPASQELSQHIAELRDTLQDFIGAPQHSAQRVLARLVHQLDQDPLAAFLSAVVPSIQFDAWYSAAQHTIGSIAGSGHLEWPIDRAQRVGLQVELCRALAEGRVRFLDFAINFYYAGHPTGNHVIPVWRGLLRPLIRDIARLAEDRSISAPLSQALGRVPQSADQKIDSLLIEACTRFKDPSPSARAVAVEKLWDAWERLKTLDDPGDKRSSVSKMLDSVAIEPKFREVLECEAKTLTEIGNTFHIRHFETNRIPIPGADHTDYLFHRLFALIFLVLSCRSGADGDA